ncbi:MAG: biopolymer transporter ExbD [Gammaproteobacteria bacterium]|nr:biopolymer transporter ExbD [Gammaproteobacteria bacterium]MDH5777778.1 biopolymer transporter ExbD [Gammaproteobacteria bacterium]
MKMSHRAKRMERMQKRGRKSSLNLVSLMDIFTILVFFLLVSSSNVQNLPSSKDIKLPSSVATKAPKESLIIAITADSILVQGIKVAQIQDLLLSQEPLIPDLEKELKFQSSKYLFASKKENTQGKTVTIMGDENLPYHILRKILATCRQANYTHIAFAARQKAKGKV